MHDLAPGKHLNNTCISQAERAVRKAELQEQRDAEKAAREETRRNSDLRSYSSLMQARIFPCMGPSSGMDLDAWPHCL